MTSVEAQERDHLDVPTHPPRFKQRIPTPPLSTGWRWGFPILLVAAITWSALLVVEGFNQVLESEEGATLDVITDVTAPGFGWREASITAPRASAVEHQAQWGRGSPGSRSPSAGPRCRSTSSPPHPGPEGRPGAIGVRG